MTRFTIAVAGTLTTAALSLLAACASTPLTPSAAATTPDCPALSAEIARAADAQRAAERKRNDAWKTPLPVAAAARFGHGMVEVTQSQQRLDDLRQQAALQGCSAPDADGNDVSTAAQGQGLRVRPSFN